jgi:hypothetical protein
MIVTECSACRDEILGHFLDGKPFSSMAREHYVRCVDCIAEVTAELDRHAAAPIPTNGAAVTKPALPDATRLALEHGREVLEREFGVNSTSNTQPTA